MPDSFKKYRAHFKQKNGQKRFIECVREQMLLSEIADLCRCSERTIRDWQREKFHMDHACLEALCKKLSLPIPLLVKVGQYDHTKNAGQLGGVAVMEKYGKVPVKESVRKEAWKKWWKTVGVNKKITTLQPRAVKIPATSIKLAEFIGIMLGDGTVAPYHIAITLNSMDDLAYSKYVANLIQELFGVVPKVYFRKNIKVLNIVVARKQLVDYLHSLGLPKGNKVRQGVRIPSWVLQDDQYARACLRGLVDTDGSVFVHYYKSKGKNYSYKKISFTSASPALLGDVMSLLESSQILANLQGRNIRIGNEASVKLYFKIIGSNNPKHLKRFLK